MSLIPCLFRHLKSNAIGPHRKQSVNIFISIAGISKMVYSDFANYFWMAHTLAFSILTKGLVMLTYINLANLSSLCYRVLKKHNNAVLSAMSRIYSEKTGKPSLKYTNFILCIITKTSKNLGGARFSGKTTKDTFKTFGFLFWPEQI